MKTLKQFECRVLAGFSGDTPGSFTGIVKSAPVFVQSPDLDREVVYFTKNNMPSLLEEIATDGRQFVKVIAVPRSDAYVLEKLGVVPLFDLDRGVLV